uniref:Protein chain release factor A n=1 Tax=uncultured SAR11 cluster alpha proteobacterium H17925_23J24 TaxID=715036 RepID=E7C9V4_9PROT|nr:protein chain release factor A [uncultured SAR11 cluster alpha proteobacterium H17925_23J24]
MIPIDKVKKVIERYISLEKELSTGKVEPKLLAKKSKEYSDLKNILPSAKEYVDFEKNKKDLNNIIEDKKNDKEMISLAEKELKDAIENKEKNEKKLKIFLLPKDKDDEKNTIVEIRAGTGGLEATLFVADLFRMYEKVCSKKGWKIEIISISKSEAKGFKEVIFSVIGENIYSYLKYESGVHRVQRVPTTEAQGRGPYICSYCCYTSRSRRCRY